MQLTNPIIITPRLLPGVQIGNAYVSIEYDGHDPDGRTVYRYHIDVEGQEYTANDLKSGCQGGSLQEGLASLLSFLGAFAESVQYASYDGEPGEYADLFPSELGEWARENSDEIAMLSIELEETENLIEE